MTGRLAAFGLALLSAAMSSATASAQTLAIEALLGAPGDLAYQGGFRLYAGSIHLDGMLYRAEGVQAIDSYTASGFLSIIADYEADRITVISPPAAAFAVVPFETPGLSRFFPVPDACADALVSEVLEHGHVRGIPAVRRAVEVTLIDGSRFHADVWQSAEGAVLLVEGTNTAGEVFSFELRTLDLGPPPADAFLVSDNLLRAERIEELNVRF